MKRDMDGEEGKDEQLREDGDEVAEEDVGEGLQQGVFARLAVGCSWFCHGFTGLLQHFRFYNFNKLGVYYFLLVLIGNLHPRKPIPLRAAVTKFICCHRSFPFLD